MFLSILSLFICIGLPLLCGIFFAWKRQGLFLSFLFGILSFSVSQLLLRIPLLSFLGSHWTWFSFLPVLNPILYYALLACSAGLFEESGRIIGLSLQEKLHPVKPLPDGQSKTSGTWLHGLAFGLGHGGMEAVWIACQGLIPALFNGTLFFYPDQAILVALERLCAMVMHIGLTMVILSGIRKRKRLRGFLTALILHAAVDFSLVTQNTVIIWSVLVLSAVLSICYLIRTKRSWNL